MLKQKGVTTETKGSLLYHVTWQFTGSPAYHLDFEIFQHIIRLTQRRLCMPCRCLFEGKGGRINGVRKKDWRDV